MNLNGNVMINGKILMNSKSNLWPRIGFVSQDHSIFCIIRDNVAYARESTDIQIQSALEAAGAWIYF